MSSSPEALRFDPYFKWLGIPKREHPPSHYRLLGITAQELDPAVIAAAAEKQIAFVRECGQKKYPEVAERLIAEINLALACLSDPAAREVYDQELKTRQPRAVRRVKQSRFDALQVSAVDETLVSPAPLVESAPPEIVSTPGTLKTGAPELELAPVKDDAAPVQALPTSQPARPAPISLGDDQPARNNPAPSAPARKPSAKSAPPAAAPQTPPMPNFPPVHEDGRDFKTSTIIKFAAGSCVLAGGITFALLWAFRSRPVEPLATPAARAASTIVAKPSTQPAVAPTTAPVGAKPPAAAPSIVIKTVKPARPKAPPVPTSAPAPANTAPAVAAAPAPTSAPAAPPAPTPAPLPLVSETVLSANWTWYPVTGKPIRIHFQKDGIVQTPDPETTGTWSAAGETIVNFRLGAETYLLTLSPSHRILTGRAPNGVAVKAVISASRATPLFKPGAKAGASADLGDEASPDGESSAWILPLQKAELFEKNWIKGQEGTVAQFDTANESVVAEGAGQIGGVRIKQPWKQLLLTLHAEWITGRMEIVINDVPLKLGTATALIRKPATVQVDFDPATSQLKATIVGRQVASAAVSAENFQSALKCEFRCETGKARLRILDMKVAP